MESGINIYERNNMGINTVQMMKLAARYDGATLPIALPMERNVIIPRADRTSALFKGVVNQLCGSSHPSVVME
jgi:hypothetical protein